jgi:prolyl-tRNA editing enzyme YbaK/EbsC (Cys-tRNA(Pro) deacylase)
MDDAFSLLLARVEQSGLPHRVIAHAPSRTMRDARDTLGFDPARIIKTTAYCGLGRPDRTLEIAPSDLLRLCDAEAAGFSKE